MTITIRDAFTHIQSRPPAPVILIDTCSFLDLFRADETPSKVPFQARVPQQEIWAASDLLELVTALPEAAHLIVPELIPPEYSDHANAIQTKFGEWTELHDRNQDWFVEASVCVRRHALAAHGPSLRAGGQAPGMADGLLAKALVLDRDQVCLDRAVHRLINKLRPSHKKEMKDSMNLEQCLELSSQLEQAGFPRSRVWVSSKTNDFAQASTSSSLHADLRGDFTTAGLRYFPSLRGALGYLSRWVRCSHCCRVRVREPFTPGCGRTESVPSIVASEGTVFHCSMDAVKPAMTFPHPPLGSHTRISPLPGTTCRPCSADRRPPGRRTGWRNPAAARCLAYERRNVGL